MKKKKHYIKPKISEKRITINSFLSFDENYPFLMEGVLLAATTCYSGGCFLAGTKIRMADDTTKSIETIKIGDVVKAYDPINENLTIDTVKRTYFDNITHEGYVQINKRLKITKAHPIYTSQNGIVIVGDLMTNDVLTSYNGNHIKISSMNSLPGTHKIYNIATTNNHGFFAEDYLVF